MYNSSYILMCMCVQSVGLCEDDDHSGYLREEDIHVYKEMWKVVQQKIQPRPTLEGFMQRSEDVWTLWRSNYQSNYSVLWVCPLRRHIIFSKNIIIISKNTCSGNIRLSLKKRREKERRRLGGSALPRRKLKTRKPTRRERGGRSAHLRIFSEYFKHR